MSSLIHSTPDMKVSKIMQNGYPGVVIVSCHDYILFVYPFGSVGAAVLYGTGARREDTRATLSLMRIY
jgi:hypothetical protein